MFSFQRSSEHPSHGPPRSLKHRPWLTAPASSAHTPPATGSGASSAGGNATPCADYPLGKRAAGTVRVAARPAWGTESNQSPRASPPPRPPRGRETLLGGPEPHSCPHTAQDQRSGAPDQVTPELGFPLDEISSPSLLSAVSPSDGLSLSRLGFS